jgi:hypothetical protein
VIKRLAALLLCLLIAAPAHAAVAILDAVVTEEVDAANSITKAFTLSAGSNRRLFACVAIEHSSGNPSSSGITYGGVALSELIGITHTGGLRTVEIWSLVDASLPAPGSSNLVVSFNGTYDDAAVAIFTVSGISQAAAKTTGNDENSDALVSDITLAGLVSTDWGFDCAINNDPTATFSSAASSSSEIFDFAFGPVSAGAAMAGATKTGSTGDTTMSQDPTAGNRTVHVGVAFAEAAAAATTIPAAPIFFP